MPRGQRSRVADHRAAGSDLVALSAAFSGGRGAVRSPGRETPRSGRDLEEARRRSRFGVAPRYREGAVPARPGAVLSCAGRLPERAAGRPRSRPPRPKPPCLHQSREPRPRRTREDRRGFRPSRAGRKTPSRPPLALLARVAHPGPCPSGEHSRTGLLRGSPGTRSEEHTSELQSLAYLVCRLLLEKKKNMKVCRLWKLID